MAHICVSKLIIIASDNGLSPARHQAIIWTNAGILLIWLLGTNFNGILFIFIQENAFENVVCEMAAILSRPECDKPQAWELPVMWDAMTFIWHHWQKHTCISWWRHQMETFSAFLALCAGNSPVPVNSPHKGQWRGALMFSFMYAWINDWVNNREAGDLRRQRGHYDVIVMLWVARDLFVGSQSFLKQHGICSI